MQCLKHRKLKFTTTVLKKQNQHMRNEILMGMKWLDKVGSEIIIYSLKRKNWPNERETQQFKWLGQITTISKETLIKVIWDVTFSIKMKQEDVTKSISWIPKVKSLTQKPNRQKTGNNENDSSARH